MSSLSQIIVVGAQGVPGGSAGAVLSVPIGFLIFVGPIYLLLRSNLGSKRGYLVLGASFFGFLFLISLFWGFGAPGTPVATGPRNLPSQVSNEYEPVWTPFAIDSRVAETEEYGFVRSYPQGFEDVPADFESTAQDGIDDMRSFFTTRHFGDSGPPPAMTTNWEDVEVRYAEATNRFPVLAVTFQQTYQEAPVPDDWTGSQPPITPDGQAVRQDPSNLAPPGTEVGEPVPDSEVTFFAFFDPGAILFPSLLVAGASLLLFLLHALLLDRDEQRERRELAALGEERERVPAGA